MRIALYSLFFIHVALSFGQQVISQSSAKSTLEQAIQLYKNGNYSASLELLERYDDMGGEDAQSDYYQAVSKLKLEREDGEIALIRFVRKHHNHFLSASAFFDLGTYYFNATVYPNAIKYFNRVTIEDLDTEQQDVWYFQKGYSHYQIGETGQALILFQESVALNRKYFFASNYYSAAIYNNQFEFDKVFEITSQMLNKKNEYSDQFLLLHVNALYDKGKWQEIIDVASGKVTTSKSYFNIQLSRFLGEAFFRLEDYRPAAETLLKHLNLSSEKMGAEAYFMLGKSYLELGNDDLAIKYLKISGLKTDEYGQLSSYYLGLLYQRNGDKNKAISAFQIAADFEGQPEIQSQSTFLAGKLSYEIRDFNKAIDFLKVYLNYDSLEPSDMLEGQELISNAYLLTPDFELAIAHMESMGSLSPQVQLAYQKVTYKKANSLFNDQLFVKSREMINKSLLYPVDQEIAAKSIYLLGEVFFITGSLKEAKSQYLTQIKNYPSSVTTNLSLYALGYLAYNNNSYTEAERYFKRFTEEGDSTHNYYLDGRLRLIDCYFVQKKWDEAKSGYFNLQSKLPNQQGYLFYRIGQINAYQKDYETARMYYRNVLNQASPLYKDESLIAIAETYLSQGNFELAVSSLDKIIDNFKNSDLLPAAYNKRAIAYFNLGNYQESMNDYRQVLQRSIRSKEAENAIYGIQSLMKAGFDVEDYAQLLANFRLNNPNNSNLENIDFEGAKSAYFNQLYQLAISRFQDFISAYPSSDNLDEAQYYLADSYYKLDRFKEAADKFLAVIDHPNTYRSRSYDKRGKALVSSGQIALAIKNYRNFLVDARSEKDAYLANEGLMNVFLLSEESDSTISFADKLIRSAWQTPGGAQQAFLVQGKAYLKAEKYEEAIDKFGKAYEDNSGASGAEAMYLKAYSLNKLNQFESSNELLFQLHTIYPGYDKWVDKSYLLIASNYIALGNLFQAKATVESIIKGSTNNDILKEANDLLKVIQLKEQEIISSNDTTKLDSIR
ncbi:MAG: tetratricopeptide repeat protein [Cyclobacteriaceae bacterium]